MAQGDGRLAEEVDLADDGVFALLFFRRNSCILGRAVSGVAHPTPGPKVVPEGLIGGMAEDVPE